MWPFKTKKRRSPKSYEAYVMCDDTRRRLRIICIGSRLELPQDYALEEYPSQVWHMMAEPGHRLRAVCPVCNRKVALLADKLQLFVHGIGYQKYRSLRNLEGNPITAEELIGRS